MDKGIQKQIDRIKSLNEQIGGQDFPQPDFLDDYIRDPNPIEKTSSDDNPTEKTRSNDNPIDVSWIVRSDIHDLIDTAESLEKLTETHDYSLTEWIQKLKDLENEIGNISRDKGWV